MPSVITTAAAATVVDPLGFAFAFRFAAVFFAGFARFAFLPTFPRPPPPSSFRDRFAIFSSPFLNPFNVFTFFAIARSSCTMLQTT